MSRNAKLIEVRSADDRLMFSLRVYDEEAGGGRANNSATQNSHAEPQKNHNANGQKDSTVISDAQKRYLFRILAEQGFEGDNAYRRLKERFGVQTLADVSKREASTMIEQLLDEAESK